MIKTRETDALLKQCKIKGRNPDPWKLCRKLERERNEAREALKRITECDMRWSKKIARDALGGAK